ncbi:GNAT family N-acetyltransferase [Alkalihalophilus lindianensis]|uniref:GNAT family N-acetyltransferase n=1 Tax=Alkalihalophilus lindianensis TaxID=1630542 RepID=A0ABU3X4T1_9BACI|nr:GNAT family N-acetyltransferase [Alkalihalophilus lindianensis]MDV2682898.1 GNAT family N-acetyltransferase [Alkalihalophilus lindianensis]
MIRAFELEDKDYIINSHYQVFNREFQYDLSFKAFIAKRVEEIVTRSDSKEQIWIVEVDGKQKGSICLMKKDEETAQLGLFLVEPTLRGAGYGQQLIEVAINFSKKVGFKRMILWTNSELTSARKLYERNRFTLKTTQIQTLSNKELIEEMWELTL